MKNTAKILNEITPLIEGNSLYVVERKKTEFDFPIHFHTDYELNFIRGAKGALRIVGDSFQEVNELELVLIGRNLEHGWRKHNVDMSSGSISEITIQFPDDLFSGDICSKKLFFSILNMLKLSDRGLSFPEDTIRKVTPLLEQIARNPTPFYKFTSFLNLMYDLASSRSYSVLSNSRALAASSSYSHRLHRIFEYISANYKKPLQMAEIAEHVNISVSTLSHFFKSKTGVSISDYILSVRIGAAAQMLIRTSRSISEICYACGFNSCQYFNRQFRKIERCSPSEFRYIYSDKNRE